MPFVRASKQVTVDGKEAKLSKTGGAKVKYGTERHITFNQRVKVKVFAKEDAPEEMVDNESESIQNGDNSLDNIELPYKRNHSETEHHHHHSHKKLPQETLLPKGFGRFNNPDLHQGRES